MRSLSLLPFIMMIVFVHTQSFCGDYDLGVRKLRWGISTGEAKQLIDEKPVWPYSRESRYDTSLVYQKESDGTTIEYEYHFFDGKFYRVDWVITYTESFDFYKAYYTEFVKKINTQYGRSMPRTWQVPDFYGNILTNHSLEWNTKNVTIELSYQGDDYFYIQVHVTNRVIESQRQKKIRTDEDSKDEENTKKAKKLIDHFDYIAKLIGVDHVGIGSDFDGIPVTPREMDDVTFLPNITRELLGRGFSEVDVRKILGGNFMRVLREVEKR